MKIFIFFLLFLVLYGCTSTEKREAEYITERIQYDVDIKSPDPDFDWWVRNIEGKNRETLVKNILHAAYEGKVEVYDYFNNPVSPEKVKKIGFRSDTLSFQRPDPPYEIYDTIVEQHLEVNEITRIRFLEEWKMDEKTLLITKRVLGISPLIRNYDENGNFRGYQPLFWVYFDERYPEVFF